MPNRQSPKKRLTLDILATSDVHGALISGDNGRQPTGGLGRIASLVEVLRKDRPNCLLVDNGDFLQGTPLCDLVATGQLPKSNDHPVIRAMNRMRYDAVGLGNHEFDFGLSFLKQTLELAEFPVIGSNSACLSQNWIKQLIIDRELFDTEGNLHATKIGIFSVMPEQVSAWNAGHLKDQLTTQDITQSAIDTAQYLRNSGAQVVIALAHSGFGGEHPEARQENAVIPIAKAAEIDAIVCGHIHQMLPYPSQKNTDCIDYTEGRICGVPAVMPSFNGSHLGQITLQLEKDEKTVKVVGSQSQLHSASPVTGTDWPGQDAEITAMARESNRLCAEALNTQIGVIETPIHSYYSHLPGDPSVATVAQAQLEYARRNLQNDLPVGVPLLSAASPFNAGGRGGPENYISIPKGRVTRMDLTLLHPFQNTLVALDVTGVQLKDWLEMAVSCFQQVQPNAPPLDLKRPDFPCYGFDTVFGVTYSIDLTQPAKFDALGNQTAISNRIFDLNWQGSRVRDDQRFIMLTTSYRAGGGGNFPNIQDFRSFAMPYKDTRELLAEFIASNPGTDQIPPSPWRFKPVPNAKATRRIGHGVLPYIAQGHHPEIEIIAGQAELSGFVPFTVNFDT